MGRFVFFFLNRIKYSLSALMLPQEKKEDDPNQAVEDLKQVTKGKTKVLYVGVTCGFSAPYVAGQLHYIMQMDNFMSVLLGFNPIEMARNVPIENWDQTFATIIKTLGNFSHS